MIKRYLQQHTAYGKSRYLNFLYKYDMTRYLEFGGKNRNDAEAIAAKIRLLVHALEKGLSVSYPKQGFGEEKAKQLLTLIDRYRACEKDPDSQAPLLAESILTQYSAFKNAHGEAVSFIPEFQSEQLPSGSVPYHQEDMSAFAEIAKRRHSVRQFSTTPISLDTLHQAVELAQTAPSACNRQANHVFACLDLEKIKKIMARHGGMRGFTIPGAILAITGDLCLYQGEYERNTVFLDGGIFVMNLLYSLGCYNLASCPIIWGVEPDNDNFLYDLLNIPRQHEILALVMVGNYPDTPVKIPVSYKRSTEDILHIIR